jgi:hypothetical protein
MIKITKKSKIFLWGPTPEVFSGGAEVINMLAAYLKERGVDAKMFSWDMETYFQPEYFKSRYDVNYASWKDIENSEDTIVIIPECMIENPDNMNCFLYQYTKVQFIVWWLSTSFTYKSLSYKTSKRLIMDNLKLMKNRSLHLCESEIAMRDLLYHGVENRMLFQHGTNDIFYNYPVTSKKEPVIIYNGMKPKTKEFVTNKIIPILGNTVEICEIRPVRWGDYMSKEELCDRFYDRAMVYIDFSGFEGRELMPREACLRDCILFLGNEGNAETFDDYPIDSYYKINRFDDPHQICDKILNAINNYEDHLKNFGFFKRKCIHEPMKWEWETSQLFGTLYKTNEK